MITTCMIKSWMITSRAARGGRGRGPVAGGAGGELSRVKIDGPPGWPRGARPIVGCENGTGHEPLLTKETTC